MQGRSLTPPPVAPMGPPSDTMGPPPAMGGPLGRDTVYPPDQVMCKYFSSFVIYFYQHYLSHGAASHLQPDQPQRAPHLPVRHLQEGGETNSSQIFLLH